MFTSEMAMLMAIVVARGSGKKLLTRPMDVTGEYIGYLYDSLARRDYIKKNNSREYHLTLKGMEALLDFLRENETRVKDTVETLQQLGIEIKQEIDKLEKEMVVVN